MSNLTTPMPASRKAKTFIIILALITLSCSLSTPSSPAATSTPEAVVSPLMTKTNPPMPSSTLPKKTAVVATLPAETETVTTEGATEQATGTAETTTGQVYYVRSDGGTADQCSGLKDAPYSGSGSAQACAWSHPFWALDNEGKWKLQGGDALVIAPGSYRMGIDSPNTDWCSMDYPWDCRLPPLPSGPSHQRPTRILGAGWNRGCKNPPELWGAVRASSILDLSNTSNAVVDCLEITDHSGCADDHCNASVKCSRDTPPYADFADQGIYAQDSANVALRHLNVHGLANAGILAGRLTDWTLEDVRISGNGSVGWNGDLGEDSSDQGTMTFRRVTVEWNGCPETYPDKKPGNCWGQEICNGYGDGFGEARTGGNWFFEDSLFRYNTSDGLDLLYVGVNHPGTMVDIRRCAAYGNAGNQFKIGGASRIINSLAVSNCAYFNQKPFAQEMGNLDSGNHCRAGGAAVSIDPSKGADAYIVNSTIVSQGWAAVEVHCNSDVFSDQPSCSSDQRLWIQNSIFLGYQVVYLDYERLSDFIGDGDPQHFTTGDTVDYNIIFNTEISSPTGSHTLLTDPLLVSSGDINALDAHLQPGSPAIDSGLAIGELNGLVPSDDLSQAKRPYGKGIDRGAYEWVRQSGMLPEFLIAGIFSLVYRLLLYWILR